MDGLPTENPVRELGVLLTRFCPAACDHCGSSSSPDVRGWIDPALAGRLLAEAAGVGVGSVILSGGEPLARFDHALDVIDRAVTAGLAVRVCTNGGWARDPDRARRRTAQLAEHGVETLMLSTDRWHLPFVPLEAVVHAARAGAEAGMRVQIAIPAAEGDFAALRLLTTLRAATPAHVYTHPVHPVGRGEALPDRVLGRTLPDLGGCHLVGHVEVDHDGTVSICPTSAEFGAASPLVLGDATSDHMGELIDRFRRTPWFAVIALWGPLGAHLAAGGRTDLSDRSAAVTRHPCHLCREVNTDDQVAASLSDAIGVDLLAPTEPERFAAALAAVAERIEHALTPPEQMVSIR
ncbi:MAG TPA: radical SAM protein [Acidimicrobiales bacterium]|nr:radical SAM protein [Acidimicrobiales bacterium]